jgi:hypothetical protein
VTAPLVVGPLQAYRCWHVFWQGKLPVLRSVYNTTLWPADGPLHATCQKGPASLTAWFRSLFSRPAKTVTHPAPTWDCQCGIYGLSHLDGDELDTSPQASPRGPDRGVTVLGVVLLWGRVIQHKHGYRAEYARPVKLLSAPPKFPAHNAPNLVDAVAQRYAIQLVSRMEELVK